MDLRADALRCAPRRGAAALAPLVLVLALVLACASAAAQAQAGSATVSPGVEPPLDSVPSVAKGRRAYTSYCARCHGLNLVVSSSAFFDLRTFPKGDKERFTRSVLKGTRAMPAWESTIKPEELESIWLYIGSVNGW